MPFGEMILVGGALLTAGLLVSLLAGRLRVPGLLLVLGLGMVLGSDGTGWIDFENYELARDVGIVALALILFEGGLTAGLPEIRPVLGPAIALALLGTLLTAVLAGLAATWLFDLTVLEGLLLGAVLSATDGAAIFAVLRGSTLRRKLARTLEGEAGMNDPIAVLLVLGFIDWIEKPDYGLPEMLLLFAQQIGIGAAVGLVCAYLAVRAFQGLRLGAVGLYPVASLAAAAVAFGAADVLHGSGFLAVYMTGVALGSANIPASATVTAFHQGIAWVGQLSMFLVLGLLVFPSQLGDVAIEGTVLALVLALLARPAAAAVATLPFSFSWRERAVLGWAGLRGAMPVVLATFAVVADVPRSTEFFNIVFFAVVISTLLQGASFQALAQRLGVTTTEPALPPRLVEVGVIRELGADVIEWAVRPGDAAVGARVRDLGLPREALLSVLVRDGEALLPRGSTVIHERDRLHILVRREATSAVRALADRWRNGPVGAPPRPRRPLTGRPPITTVRPWGAADGDPARPSELNGIEVVETLRTRQDRPGAAVILADGRYAITGPLLVLGSRRAVQEQARRMLQLSDDDADLAWWQEVIGACAL